MCGRFSLFAPPADVEERFDATFDFEYEPRYNAAPGQALPVVTGDEPDLIQRMEWGLIPGWADDRSDFEFVNARAETAAEKPSFRSAYEKRRCLVPADGFYEWAPANGSKQPYRIIRADDGIFAMAGLWERWTPPQTQAGLGDFGDDTAESAADDAGSGATADPEPLETFTVLTTEPNDVVADLHDRMPVILAPDEEETWITGDPDEVRQFLDAYPSGETRAYPVSTAVNDPANDSPAVVREVET